MSEVYFPPPQSTVDLKHLYCIYSVTRVLLGFLLELWAAMLSWWTRGWGDQHEALSTNTELLFFFTVRSLVSKENILLPPLLYAWTLSKARKNRPYWVSSPPHLQSGLHHWSCGPWDRKLWCPAPEFSWSAASSSEPSPPSLHTNKQGLKNTLTKQEYFLINLFPWGQDRQQCDHMKSWVE